MIRRNTLQRELVLEALHILQNHPTAAEICACLTARYPTIAKATVYRNLNVLADEGVIRRIQIPNAPDRFDHVFDKHFHLQCTVCGCLFDVVTAPIPDLKESVLDGYGAIVSDYDIVFRGICPDCQNKTKKE